MTRVPVVIIGIVFVITCAAPHAPAQTLYKLPNASSGNTIELAVSNPSNVALAGVIVYVTSAPPWIEFSTAERKLNIIKSKQEEKVRFTFSVDRHAPVNEEQRIIFTIRNNSGRVWKKEFKITVSAPDHFELFQNFPNPFNPTTTIRYQIPSPSHIKIVVFNMLGQMVATILDQDRTAGSYDEIFDAKQNGSGVYVYRIIVTDQNGAHHQAQKTMILLK